MLFLLLAGVSTILGHTVYNWSLKYVTAPLVSASLLGEPILRLDSCRFHTGRAPISLYFPWRGVILAGVLFVVYDEMKIKGQRTR